MEVFVAMLIQQMTTIFSLRFDNFGKVHVSIEDLAVRRMYVDPDRLLFMFDEPILIF